MPPSITPRDITHFIDYIKTEKLSALIEPLKSLLGQLNQDLSVMIRKYLKAFFTYADAIDLQFDYKDCALGNIIFAGAYLEKANNFNAAAQAMSQLVSSRAVLLNVSQGENRILVGLKEDGELLKN